MDITTKAKDELEHKIHDLEEFISKKGLGSAYLNRAKRVQRNVNVAIAVGSIITLAGITIWALSGHGTDEE